MQAGVRFFRGKPRTAGKTSRRVLVKKETLAMGGAVSLSKSESEVHVSISGTCIYNTYSNPSAYITQKNHTSSARSGEDGCSGPRDWCGIEFNNAIAPTRRSVRSNYFLL